MWFDIIPVILSLIAIIKNHGIDKNWFQISRKNQLKKLLNHHWFTKDNVRERGYKEFLIFTYKMLEQKIGSIRKFQSHRFHLAL